MKRISLLVAGIFACIYYGINLIVFLVALNGYEFLLSLFSLNETILNYFNFLIWVLIVLSLICLIFNILTAFFWNYESKKFRKCYVVIIFGIIFDFLNMLIILLLNSYIIFVTILIIFILKVVDLSLEPIRRKLQFSQEVNGDISELDGISIAERLLNLERLKKKRIITQEEYMLLRETFFEEIVKK